MGDGFLEWEGLGGPPAGKIAVPRAIGIEEDGLIWDWFAEGGPREVTPPAHLLARFVELADAPPVAILAFARRWGVLGICDHGLPSSHRPGCAPLAWDEEHSWEPLAAWWRFARQARAIRRIASELREGGRAPLAEWQLLSSRAGQPVGKRPGRLKAERLLLTETVNGWLAIGGARPQLLWRGDTPKVVVGGSLFATIAVQLLSAVSASSGFEFCDNCGKPYTPRRRPARGRRHYCPECRASGAPSRDSSRDHRRRRAP